MASFAEVNYNEFRFTTLEFFPKVLYKKVLQITLCFADIQYCRYAELVVGWVRKKSKIVLT